MAYSFFRSSLSEGQMQQWGLLIDMLQGVEVSEGHDQGVCAVERHGIYTSSSLYKQLSFGGVVSVGK